MLITDVINGVFNGVNNMLISNALEMPVIFCKKLQSAVYLAQIISQVPYCIQPYQLRCSEYLIPYIVCV